MTQDTVFQSITFTRPGATRSNEGKTVPSGIRVTYNLNVPLLTMLEHCPETEPGVELTKEDVDTLLKNGATYVDFENSLVPGYVVMDSETGEATHWQFYKNNSLFAHVHKMNGKVFGSEHCAPPVTQNGITIAEAKKNRELTQLECDFMAQLMQATQNGKINPFTTKPIDLTPDYVS